MELESGISRIKPPVHRSSSPVAVLGPDPGLATHTLNIRRAPIQTLVGQDGELDLQANSQPGRETLTSVSAVEPLPVGKSDTGQRVYGY